MTLPVFSLFHNATCHSSLLGRAHYIKRTGERRHLFWKPAESAWQISPVCNDDEVCLFQCMSGISRSQGAYALSAGVNIEGTWRSIPASLVERGNSLQMFTEHELEVREHRVQHRGAGWMSVLRFLSLLMSIDPPAEESVVSEKAILSGAELQESLLRWNDSNHECLLFSNENHGLCV
jgi:hypothetical protein